MTTVWSTFEISLVQVQQQELDTKCRVPTSNGDYRAFSCRQTDIFCPTNCQATFSQKLGSSSRLDWSMDFHFHVTVFHACSPLCTGSFCCEPHWAEGQVPRFQGRCMSVLRATPADEGRRWQVPRLQERLSVEALHQCGRVLGDHEQDERHVQGEGRLQEVLWKSDGGIQGGRGQAGRVSLPPAQVSVHEWCSRQSNHP